MISTFQTESLHCENNSIGDQMDTEITPHKIVEQNELQIVLQKTFEFTSHVMGYHEYKDRWTAVKGEILRAVMEPKNKTDKFAVAVMKMTFWSDIYQKEKQEDLQKLFSTSFEPVTQTLAPSKLLETDQSRRWKRNEGALQVMFCG